MKINIPFGTKLTDRAVLPAGSKRDLTDPYEDKEAARRKKLVTALVIVAIAAAVFIRWDRHRHGRYFWQEPAKAEAPAAPATPAAPSP